MLKEQDPSREREQALAGEVEALKNALRTMDVERDNLQEAADGRAQENRVLTLQLDDGQHSVSSLQLAIEELRRNLDVANGQLTDREGMMLTMEEQLTGTQQSLEQSRADNMNLRRDLDLHADDLTVMTRENAALNEQVR